MTVLLTGAVTLADSWEFERGLHEQKFVFGSVTVARVVDARTNIEYPKFWVEIRRKERVLAAIQDASFDEIFASRDNEFFLGLSNSGLPGTAILLFDVGGNVLLNLRHGETGFEYCSMSVTLHRTWYSHEAPAVEFVVTTVKGKRSLQGLLVTDCRGKRLSLEPLLKPAQPAAADPAHVLQ